VNGREWTGFQERGAASYTLFGAAWSSETRFGYNLNEIIRVDRFWDGSIDPSQPPETFFGGRRIASFTVSTPSFDDGGGAEYNSFFGPVWSLEEKFARHSGRHSFKFGGIYTSRGAGRINSENPRVQFANRADLFANIPSRFQFQFGNNRYRSHSYDTGAFVQDDWRITPRLVINLGVRYDYFSNMVARPVNPKELAGFFNLDGLLDDQFHFGPFRDPARPVNPDGWANFGPRLGFSYNPDGKGVTVLRGGFGMMFAPQPRDDYNSAVGRSTKLPVIAIFSKAEAAANGMRFPFFNEEALKIVEASPQTQVGSIFDPNTQNPYSMNLYFGVQRALTSSSMFETAFVGNRGVKFRLLRQYNEVNRLTGIRPNPDIGGGRYFSSDQDTVYYSWQTSLRKRYSKGLTGSVHYTWGKALSYSGGDTGAGFSGDTFSAIQDFFDRRANRGPSAGDVSHRFVAESVYETPQLAGAGPVLRQIAGAWQLSGVFTAATGEPLLITQGSSISASRPDYVGGNPVMSDHRQSLQYLNRAAFARVPIVTVSGAPVRAGNLGNGAVRLPGRWNLDFSVSKYFPLTEQVRFQLRADMFNSLNHTNFSALTTNLNSGSFGRFTRTTGARIIQLNARISW